jgi:hypothetical protein
VHLVGREQLARCGALSEEGAMDERRDQRHEAAQGGASPTLEQVRAELERVKKSQGQFDTHTHWSGKELRGQRQELGALSRRVGLLSAGVVMLALIALGCGAWVFHKIREGETVLASIPEAGALRAEVDARVDEFSEMLADLSADSEIIQGFADRIAQLESAGGTTAEALRADVEQAARIDARERLETRRQLDEIAPRIEAAEAAGAETFEHLAALEDRLEAVQSQLSADLAALEGRTGDLVQSVDARVAGNARGLEALSWEVGRERLDFELFEDYRMEVAPGVVLTVSNTDVSFQKIDGWIHLVDEGRFVRLEDHPIQKSLVFYGLGDERSYELVFTRVRPEAAIGYVRVPSEDGVRIVNRVIEPGFESQISAIP